MIARALFILLFITWSAQLGAQMLVVSAEEKELLGIRVETLDRAAAGNTADITFRVGFSPDGEWAIKTPFPGILQRAWVQSGDRVSAGDPLVAVRSPEVVSLQRSFLKAGAELTLQESAWERDRKLRDAGSVSNRRWQETLHAYNTARAEYAGLRAQLLLAGFSEPDLERLVRDMDISPDITLRAPVDAIVLERPAMLGEHLEGTELLARLGEPGKLVLEGILSKQAAAHLHEGMRIIMQGAENQAVIVLVSSVIDPATQTVSVRAEPERPDGLVPGQLTRWSVQSGNDLLMVPSRAVVKLDGIDVIYVEVSAGFEPRPVAVRSTGSGDWIVLQGLNAGERVAVSGTSVLKAMSLGMGGGDN